MSATRLRHESATIVKGSRKRKWLERSPSNKIWDTRLLFNDGTDLLYCQTDLSTMSKYFATMFESEFTESRQREIKIEDVQAKVMEAMVASCYTFELDLHAENVETYAWAADRFVFPHVTAACWECISGTLAPTNAINFLNLYATSSFSSMRACGRN
eukprot:jgi/Botrbrau1/12747/Bobra.67_1s0106.1